MEPWERLRADSLVFEDRDLLALNKPAGISVVGERSGTDLLRLAKEAGEYVNPIHRIDKATSGLILLAKNSKFHGTVTRQFAKRSVLKAYLAITKSTDLPEFGVIDLPVMTASNARVRIAALRDDIRHDEESNRWYVRDFDVYKHVRSYPSQTIFARLFETESNSVVLLRPVTGRRHQIRVHLAWIGHPINGDPLFDKKAAARGERTALHSWALTFQMSDTSDSKTSLTAAPGNDFWTPIERASDPGTVSTIIADARDRFSELDSVYLDVLQSLSIKEK
ncbi:RNA pseudouridine synthase [Glycomyces sp. L485]|uniref:pseudouridine synthase family protein n=1 Tax=Glycomyces sp. L485 TaxID=2909235 RepID=UPI001F4BCD8C|nr:RNA pseudouridine synthase [Glycomyces sp. L485]MCH7231767.1 RNA pseudouridine synthase [Glycomyces sp. L485]